MVTAFQALELFLFPTRWRIHKKVFKKWSEYNNIVSLLLLYLKRYEKLCSFPSTSLLSITQHGRLVLAIRLRKKWKDIIHFRKKGRNSCVFCFLLVFLLTSFSFWCVSSFSEKNTRRWHARTVGNKRNDKSIRRRQRRFSLFLSTIF